MSSIGSPKIIPRVHLSPKIKQLVRNPQFKKISPKRKPVRRTMRASPMRNSPKRFKQSSPKIGPLAPAKVVPIASAKVVPMASVKDVPMVPVKNVPMAPKSVSSIPVRVKSPNRTKTFITQRESFRSKPTVNPVTNRNIKTGGDTYNKLVKLYGKPY